MRKILTVGMVAFGIVGSGFAFSYTDVQTPEVSLDTLDTYNGAFNIVNPGSDSVNIGGTTYTDIGGFVPGTSLSDVTVTFWFTDKAHSIPNLTFVVGLGSIELGAWNGTTQTFSFEGTTGAIDFLQDNGHIDYTVGSLLGSFTLADALLQADVSQNVSSVQTVPDGGTTLTLLGLGLFAVIVAKKGAATAKYC